MPRCDTSHVRHKPVERLKPDGASSYASVISRSRKGEETAVDGVATLRAKIEWTFPPAFAELVSGDGARVYRERIDLTDARPFGSRTISQPLDLRGRKWARLEVWDVAANGAFTQPVFLGP